MYRAGMTGHHSGTGDLHQQVWGEPHAPAVQDFAPGHGVAYPAQLMDYSAQHGSGRHARPTYDHARSEPNHSGRWRQTQPQVSSDNFNRYDRPTEAFHPWEDPNPTQYANHDSQTGCREPQFVNRYDFSSPTDAGPAPQYMRNAEYQNCEAAGLLDTGTQRSLENFNRMQQGSVNNYNQAGDGQHLNAVQPSANGYVVSQANRSNKTWGGVSQFNFKNPLPTSQPPSQAVFSPPQQGPTWILQPRQTSQPCKFQAVGVSQPLPQAPSSQPKTRIQVPFSKPIPSHHTTAAGRSGVPSEYHGQRLAGPAAKAFRAKSRDFSQAMDTVIAPGKKTGITLSEHYENQQGTPDCGVDGVLPASKAVVGREASGGTAAENIDSAVDQYSQEDKTASFLGSAKLPSKRRRQVSGRGVGEPVDLESLGLDSQLDAVTRATSSHLRRESAMSADIEVERPSGPSALTSSEQGGLLTVDVSEARTIGPASIVQEDAHATACREQDVDAPDPKGCKEIGLSNDVLPSLGNHSPAKRRRRTRSKGLNRSERHEHQTSPTRLRLRTRSSQRASSEKHEPGSGACIEAEDVLGTVHTQMSDKETQQLSQSVVPDRGWSVHSPSVPSPPFDSERPQRGNPCLYSKHVEDPGKRLIPDSSVKDKPLNFSSGSESGGDVPLGGKLAPKEPRSVPIRGTSRNSMSLDAHIFDSSSEEDFVKLKDAAETPKNPGRGSRRALKASRVTESTRSTRRRSQSKPKQTNKTSAAQSRGNEGGDSVARRTSKRLREKSQNLPREELADADDSKSDDDDDDDFQSPKKRVRQSNGNTSTKRSTRSKGNSSSPSFSRMRQRSTPVKAKKGTGSQITGASQEFARHVTSHINAMKRKPVGKKTDYPDYVFKKMSTDELSTVRLAFVKFYPPPPSNMQAQGRYEQMYGEEMSQAMINGLWKKELKPWSTRWWGFYDKFNEVVRQKKLDKPRDRDPTITAKESKAWAKAFYEKHGNARILAADLPSDAEGEGEGQA